MGRPLRILTWHVHGSYLWYLSHTGHELYLPVQPDGQGGLGGPWEWPDTVKEIPAESVRDHDFDCVLFQSHQNWLTDRFEILSDSQLEKLPRIFLEHDPPREHPTDTRHPVDDTQTLVVHVTGFNQLMWDNGDCPTVVIDHGISLPEGIAYDGSMPAGIAVVNNLRLRGRRLGHDVFVAARRQIPIDLYGMDATSVFGGVGEVPHTQLPAIASRYRFSFNPIRYTSMGLAICETMMIGIPVVTLATAEQGIVVRESGGGFADTDPARLVEAMQLLIEDRDLARALGQRAREYAKERYSITRFCQEWDGVFRDVAGSPVTSTRTRTLVKGGAG